MSVAENIAGIRERIAAAARRAGREAGDVRLVAVSKTRTADELREAHTAGCREFGENYQQELLDKAAALADLELRWHHIGQLQSNKVRALIGKVSLFHAVDRASLLAEIERRASQGGVRCAVLLQVNVAGEAQKGGCRPEGLPALLEAAARCRSLDVRGLMTMPPAVDDPEDARRWFRGLRELRDRVDPLGLRELSMGMSHDFEVAIEEGATLVRVGTSVFGERVTAA